MSLQMPDAVHGIAEAYRHDMNEQRDDTLCEVLSMITEKLDPTGDTNRQMILVEVLRDVNAMRSDVDSTKSNENKSVSDDAAKK